MLTLERPLCLIFSYYPHLGKYQLQKFSQVRRRFLIEQYWGSRLAEANPIKIGAKMILRESLKSSRRFKCLLNPSSVIFTIEDYFVDQISINVCWLFQMRLLNKILVFKGFWLKIKIAFLQYFCCNFLVVVKGLYNYKCPKRKI